MESSAIPTSVILRLISQMVKAPQFFALHVDLKKLTRDKQARERSKHKVEEEQQRDRRVGGRNTLMRMPSNRNVLSQLPRPAAGVICTQ